MDMTIIERIRAIVRPKQTGDESKGWREMKRRDIATFEKARDAMALFGDLLNGGSKEAVLTGMVEGLAKPHRYLQNEAIITLFYALGEFGGLPEGQYTDPRNAFAHKLCGLLRERFKDELFWKDE
jgi:hypothetical protein